jgi:hypothetical protein
MEQPILMDSFAPDALTQYIREQYQFDNGQLSALQPLCPQTNLGGSQAAT